MPPPEALTELPNAPLDDCASTPSIFLPPGAALVVGPNGSILLGCNPFPFFHMEGSSLRGRCLEEIEPPALGESLGRLWRSFCRDKSLHVSEVEIGLEPGKPVAHYSLSLGAAPHPVSCDYCVITVRNVTRHTSEVQDLLSTLQTLREQCSRWEVTTRTVAHDVRSSLSAMTGFLQLSLLEKENISPVVEDHLVRAFQIGKHLLGVLRDLEQCSEPLLHNLEKVTVTALGQRLFHALQAAFPEVLFTWHVESTDEVVHVPIRITWSALWNVLTNAVKYRHQDRPLHIGLRAWIENDTVQLQLRDNGKGIPGGEEEAVFDHGWRGGHAEGTNGSGFGLFSARRQLAAYGGRIWIQPAPDGAVIRVSLPMDGGQPVTQDKDSEGAAWQQN